MEKPSEEIITLRAEMRDMKEDVRIIKISIVDIQQRLLKLTKNNGDITG